MAVLDRDRILGYEPMSVRNKRLYVIIGISVLFALLIAGLITFFIIYFAESQEDIRLDLGLKDPWYMRRADWSALPDFGKTLIDMPVPNVVIGHSAGIMCLSRSACINDVLGIQRDHQGRDWNDIGPNFLVGGNGDVFEGRGANLVGIMVSGWNSISITVMFLGNYVNDMPTPEQFANVNSLLEELVRVGALNPDYVVLGHCQATPNHVAPGPNLMDNMHNFEHWDPTNSTTACLRS